MTPKLEMGQVCKRCSVEKARDAFSWQDYAHSRKDIYCKACRAERKRARHVPRCAIKPATYPYGLTERVCDHIAEGDLQYLAGIIDGEGCIMSSYPRSRVRPLILKISMVHRPTIAWICNTVGGGVVAHRTNQKPARQSWTWSLCGVRAYALLRRIEPFMKTKRAEALVAIRIGETFFVNQTRGKVSDEVHALRDVLGQQMRDLKTIEWLA